MFRRLSLSNILLVFVFLYIKYLVKVAVEDKHRNIARKIKISREQVLLILIFILFVLFSDPCGSATFCQYTCFRTLSM